MRTEQNSSKIDKTDILKRLIRRFSSSDLSPNETVDALKRLAYKLYKVNLPASQVLENLKRKWKKYSS